MPWFVFGTIAVLSSVALPFQSPTTDSLRHGEGASLAPSDTTIGSWQYVERVDAMTDEVLRFAQTRNAEGFELRIFRVESGKVHGLFRVPNASADILSSERWPMYRVDQHEAVDLERSRSIAGLLDEPPVIHEPKWIQFLIWHGSDSYPDSGTLSRLMHGERLVVRYHLFTGGYKETVFSLAGAHDVIVRALELSPPDTLKR